MSKEVPANLPKPQIDPELKKKGAVGQDELQAWFDRNGFSYVAICQAESTFARLFTNEVKRPDFLLVVDGLGMIAVDAKHCEPQKIGKAYTLNYDGEVRKAIMFERVFRLPVWYAYRGQTPGEWLWISALKAFEVGQLAGKEEGKYLELQLKDFVVIQSGADFGRLYTQRLPGCKKLASRLSPDARTLAPKENGETSGQPAAKPVRNSSVDQRNRVARPGGIAAGSK